MRTSPHVVIACASLRLTWHSIEWSVSYLHRNTCVPLFSDFTFWVLIDSDLYVTVRPSDWS